MVRIRVRARAVVATELGSTWSAAHSRMKRQA
jgi:hypothetical protein